MQNNESPINQASAKCKSDGKKSNGGTRVRSYEEDEDDITAAPRIPVRLGQKATFRNSSLPQDERQNYKTETIRSNEAMVGSDGWKERKTKSEKNPLID